MLTGQRERWAARVRTGVRETGRRRVLSRRAVSEVVATIILLGLTVTLFAAIFAWVTTFPAPPAQNSNQFQANLVTGTNSSTHSGAVVTAVKIIHLAGPTVPTSALVYLKSAVEPLGYAFTTPESPYSMAAGGITGVWNLGQTWTVTFPSGEQPTLPDNITVLVTSGSNLLFSVILPGQSFVYPPTFVSAAVTPSTPVVGATFNVTAVLSGSYVPYSVYINMGAVPGFTTAPTTAKMTYSQATGEYYVLLDAANGSAASGIGSSIRNGTFYAVLNATGTNGQPATYVLPITFLSALSFSGPVKLASTTATTLATINTTAPKPAGQQLLVSWTVFCHPVGTTSTTPTLTLTYDNSAGTATTVTLYSTAMTKNYLVAYGTTVIIATYGAPIKVTGLVSSTASTASTIYAAVSISQD